MLRRKLFLGCVLNTRQEETAVALLPHCTVSSLRKTKPLEQMNGLRNLL